MVVVVAVAAAAAAAAVMVVAAVAAAAAIRNAECGPAFAPSGQNAPTDPSCSGGPAPRISARTPRLQQC